MNLIIFYIFAGLLVISASVVVFARNSIYSVLFLILSFFCTAGIFILQGAEFLAMLLVIVYVGAVAILFLFVIMMLNIDYNRLKGEIFKILPFGVLFAIIFLLEIYVAFNNASDGAVFISSAFPKSNDITNTRALGEILYTDFCFHFQIAGILLLLSMIGAVMLTHQKRDRVKRQDVMKQVLRSKKDSLRVVKVLTGKGV